MGKQTVNGHYIGKNLRGSYKGHFHKSQLALDRGSYEWNEDSYP